jgi:Polyketide cyclase / dehydrase and lipid transport
VRRSDFRANVDTVAAPFRFDRTWWFPVAPEQLWAVLHRTDRYPGWWSWLREFEAEGFEPGTTARCVIQSPLPYALRCTISVDEMRTAAEIVTTVSGDLRGPARLEVRGVADGCTARLVWSLVPGSPVLRHLARIGRPAMVWAHDRVVATGVDQFRRRALVPERDLRT